MNKKLYFNVKFSQNVLKTNGYLESLLESLTNRIKIVESGIFEQYYIAKTAFWADLVEAEFISVYDKMFGDEKTIPVENRGDDPHFNETITKYKTLRSELDELNTRLKNALKQTGEDKIKDSFKYYSMVINSRYLYIKNGGGKTYAEQYIEFENNKKLQAYFKKNLEIKAKKGNKYLYGGIISGSKNTNTRDTDYFYGTLKTRFVKNNTNMWQISSNVFGFYPDFDKFPKIMNKSNFYNLMKKLGITDELLIQFEKAEDMSYGD